MAHIHSVYDTDQHFNIDPITRTINCVSGKKTTVIQYDHNSERFTFELPRHIEGHDMLTCNLVEVHYINIDKANKSKANAGTYIVSDLLVSPDDENIVICSWLISQDATQYAGSLNFLLRFSCVTEDVGYAWNTAIHTGISVSDGMHNSTEGSGSGSSSSGSSGGSGGITSETDPTVPAWAKQPSKPTYTADEVGAQPKGNYALQSDVNKLSADIEALKGAGGGSVSFTVDAEGNATIQ